MQALRAARIARQAGVRYMSSGLPTAEAMAVEAKEANKWKIVTFAMIPLCIGKAFVDLSAHHAHATERPNYPYMHIRAKPFPWGDDGLFESKH